MIGNPVVVKKGGGGETIWVEVDITQSPIVLNYSGDNLPGIWLLMLYDVTNKVVADLATIYRVFPFLDDTLGVLMDVGLVSDASLDSSAGVIRITLDNEVADLSLEQFKLFYMEMAEGELPYN